MQCFSFCNLIRNWRTYADEGKNVNKYSPIYLSVRLCRTTIWYPGMKYAMKCFFCLHNDGFKDRILQCKTKINRDIFYFILASKRLINKKKKPPSRAQNL